MSECIQHYLDEFDSLQSQRSSKGAPWLQAIRLAARESFAKNGFPTRKDEAWKYTNTRRIAEHRFTSNAVEATHIEQEQFTKWLIPELDCYRIVFINGIFSSEYSQVEGLLETIKFDSMANLISEDSESIKDLIKDNSSNNYDAFGALNISFLQDGAYLNIGKNTVIDKPIHIIYANTQPELMTSLRNAIILEQGAAAKVLESYAGLDDICYFNNCVTEIKLGPQSSLEHYKVQQQGSRAYHIDHLYAQQSRGSQLKTNSFALGGELVRSDTSVDINSSDVSSDLNGLYLGKGDRHIDHHTTINHNEAHSNSSQNYKGIIDDQARCVFNGKVYVAKDAQKSLAEQHNKNLLLTKTAEVDTKPQLEIYADDVKCAHGATVGQLDKKSLFYLRSRGIPEQLAKTLLVKGFAKEIVDRVQLPALKNYLDKTLEDMRWSQ